VAASNVRVYNLASGITVVGNIDIEAPINIDRDMNLEIDQVPFASKLQVINATIGQNIFIIHDRLKSNYIEDSEAQWNVGGNKRKQFIQNALENRRRIIDDAFRIRKSIDAIHDCRFQLD
jgi:hypothetical protein